MYKVFTFIVSNRVKKQLKIVRVTRSEIYYENINQAHFTRYLNKKIKMVYEVINLQYVYIVFQYRVALN